MNQIRLSKVLTEMKASGVEQLLISDPTTIFYLMERWIHPGERMLVLIIKSNGEHVLVINRLFPMPKLTNPKLVYFDDTQDGVTVLLTEIDPSKTIGIDKTWPAHFLLNLMKQGQTTDFVLSSDITDHVRALKSQEEIQLMKDVSADNDQAMGELQALIPAKLTELTMTKKLAEIYAKLDNSGFSFDPIVAYGANGADPHHMNDESVVKAGDSIILDIGGTKNGYCSDMTRTFFYQSVSDKSRDVYETVLEANKRAIAAVKPGVPFSQIDAAARDYITEKGYGEFFTHRTGHFIGIECHEAGDVSAANHQLVEPGMIFSIEPGIYLAGEVGVRIEDLVVATTTGCELLNHYPKELTIIP